MADASELSLLRAIQATEQRLSATFTKGLDELKNSLSALQNAHASALLEQAKANATFADRDRVEAIAATSHNNGNHLTVLQGKVSKLELDQANAGTSHSKALHDRWDRIISACSLTGAVLLGAVLTHFIH